MILLKLALLACPAVLSLFMLVASPVQAGELPAPGLFQQTEFGHHGSIYPWQGIVGQVSSEPLIPRGCACARCAQSADMLQGRLPEFLP